MHPAACFRERDLDALSWSRRPAIGRPIHMIVPHAKALRSGQIHLGSWQLECHVLEDERRVITQSAFMEIMGFRGRGNDRGHRMTHFLDSPEFKHLQLSRLIADIRNPFVFRPVAGGIAYGYEGALIVDYCEALLKARRQRLIGGEVIERYCQAAESLVLSVAKVGIVALIDEATGYQEIREKLALQAILDRYLRAEWAKWAKRFPDEFYAEMFRLKGWEWTGKRVNRPAVVGHYTNDVVYSRLAPGVLDELRRRNPTDDKGRRRRKHHQWMTDDIGHPALSQHVHALVAMMRASPDWAFFRRLVDRSFPRVGQTYLLNLEEQLPSAP